MTTNSKFQLALMDLLAPTKYVLMNPTSDRSNNFDILLSIDDLQSMIESLNQFPDLLGMTVSYSFKSSDVVMKFSENVEMKIHFIHKFEHKSLIYLDEKEVMQKRVKELDGFYIPCVEHLFEHWVLKSFLELKGIGRAAFRYFNEFHILVQEDLVDYFNLKYGTSFSSINQLTDFEQAQRIQIIKKIKNAPDNNFLKKVNIRWHNFLGVMRQARFI